MRVEEVLFSFIFIGSKQEDRPLHLLEREIVMDSSASPACVIEDESITFRNVRG